MKDTTGALVAIFSAIVGVAIIAVLVSKNAQTTGVLGGIFNGFSSVIKAAVAPVSGAGIGGTSINV